MTSGGPSLAWGIGWLLADMTLVTCMQVLVKTQGMTYPAIQIVFLRALVGLVMIMLFLGLRHEEITAMRHPGRNALRVICNAVALSLRFVALTTLPNAMANAIGFAPPLVV